MKKKALVRHKVHVYYCQFSYCLPHARAKQGKGQFQVCATRGQHSFAKRHKLGGLLQQIGMFLKLSWRSALATASGIVIFHMMTALWRS